MVYEKIWQKILNPDEKIEYEFSIGKRYRMFGLICWGIVSIPLLFLYGIGVLTFLIALFYYGFYLKVANAYAFTNRRIIIHRGWLSTKVISVDYEKITDITVVEPLLDRLITHTGHLAINTAGTTFQEVMLTHIAHPYEIKKKLDHLRDQYQSR